MYFYVSGNDRGWTTIGLTNDPIKGRLDAREELGLQQTFYRVWQVFDQERPYRTIKLILEYMVEINRVPRVVTNNIRKSWNVEREVVRLVFAIMNMEELEERAVLVAKEFGVRNTLSQFTDNFRSKV